MSVHLLCERMSEPGSLASGCPSTRCARIVAEERDIFPEGGMGSGKYEESVISLTV
jgi:hypothetical protein